MVIRVGDHRELQAVVLALTLMDRTLAADIAKSTKALLDTVWKPAVDRHATTAVDRAVIGKGVRVKAGVPPVAMAAQSSKAMRGGLVPGQRWAVYELGTKDRERFTTYDRHVAGHVVSTRRRTRHQLPTYRRAGRVALPAFAETAPRAVSLWVQMMLAKSAEAMGVKR